MARQPKRNRRSQDPSMLVTGAPVVATIASAGASTISIALDRPCSVNGSLEVAVATRTLVSQAVVDLQHLTQTFSGTIATKTFSVAPGQDAVRSSDGGRVASTAGTFP